MNAVFIMSSERSGSNLLRKMLGAHSEVSDPPPPHMWRHLSPNVFRYGKLTEIDNLVGLLSDAISMTQVEGSHLQWKYNISNEDVLKRVKTNNLTGVIVAIYEAYAFQDGATIWVCKENNLFDHAFQIRNTLPNAKFIYLCRDGRDVACSIKKVPSHDQHIWFIAKEWRKEQQQCLLVHQELLHHRASTLVRYEDLISNPEYELRRICDFAEINYESHMIEFYKMRDSKDDASKTKYWANLAQPVMSNNKAKFFKELSREEIILFETVASDVLGILGYPLVGSDQQKRIGRGRQILYYLSNKFQVHRQRKKLLKEEGRKERASMLENIYHQKMDKNKSFADPIDYK